MCSSIESTARSLVTAVKAGDNDLQTQLLDALAKNITDADKINPITDAFRNAAKAEFHRDGEIEVDGDSVVSLSEYRGVVTGAYVAAWVFVDRSSLN